MMPEIGFAQISAPVSLDYTWQAIQVVQGTPEMSLHGASVYDETTGQDYHHSVDRPTFPVEIPWGDICSVSILSKNTGDVPVKARILVEFVDPTGIVLDSEWEPTYGYFTVSPGSFFSSKRTAGFSMNIEGMWLIYGRIEFEVA